MANRKFMFVNADEDFEQEALSVSVSIGAGDSGKLATLDAAGKWDLSMIPSSILNGLDWKQSVRVCVNTNIVLTGPGATIDGVAMVLNDRVLLIGQTLPAQNGIYLWKGALVAMVRSTDADTALEVTSGLTADCTEGTSANKVFHLVTADPIVVDTTALTFEELGINTFTGGNGISIIAGLVSVDLDTTPGLEFNVGKLRAKTAVTSVVGDLDGTNGIHYISAQDLSSNGVNQGAKVLGADPLNISQSSQTNVQGILEDISAAIGGVVMAAGTGGVTKGDLLYISANDTVLPLPISGANAGNFGIGLASTTELAGVNVSISANDKVLTGVLTLLTPVAGAKVFWTGSALSLTAPNVGGSIVNQAGVAKNVNDLYVDIRRIKKNAV